MEEKFCQCCGMPMGTTDELYGKEKDGSKSRDYCSYCYEDGAFTFEGSMEEMIELCIPPTLEANKELDEIKAREMMMAWIPTLKRWNPVHKD